MCQRIRRIEGTSKWNWIFSIYIVHTADGIFTKKLNETFSPAAPIELFSDKREHKRIREKLVFCERGRRMI